MGVESSQTLVEDCVQWVTNRIHGQVFRPGMRVPSIRVLAREKGVSPFTVVEAYDRLVASGCLQARKGSGFYVTDYRSDSYKEQKKKESGDSSHAKDQPKPKSDAGSKAKKKPKAGGTSDS